MFAGGITLIAFLAIGQAPVDQTAGRLSGRVVEQARQAPIANARVDVFSMSRPAGGPPPMFQAITDADGQFSFDVLPAGAYRVQASRPGFASQSFDTQPVIVEVQAGQARDGVIVSLQRGGVITGRVLDASGDVVPEVQVMPLRKFPNSPAGATGLMPGGPAVPTNDLGEYRLFGLAPGEYYVQAMPRPMMVPYSVTSAQATVAVPTLFPNGRTADAAQMVVVAAGETVPDVNIHLAVTPAFRVSGIVADESGAPVGGAMITVMAEERPMGGMPAMFAPPAMSRSNADGTFSLPNIAPGTYSVRAGLPMNGGGAGGFGFISGGIGAVSSTVGAIGNTVTWSTSSAGGPGTVTNFGDSQVRVTVSDTNVEGIRVVVRRQ